MSHTTRLAAGEPAAWTICLIASPEGLEIFHQEHPDVRVYTTAIAEKLNEYGYIIPGLGDVGDKIYGTKQPPFFSVSSLV